MCSVLRRSPGILRLSSAGMLRRFAIELGLWYVGPCAFLALYVLRFAQPASAIAPHLVVVTLPLLALFCTRIVLVRLANPDFRRWGTAIVMATLFCSVLVYYLLVLIGLHSWGGVVAWNVIPTFFAQASVLADALGISSNILLASSLATYLLICAFFLAFLKGIDWVESLVQRLSAPTLVLLCVAMVFIVGLEGLQLVAGMWVHRSEPMSLTLHPSSGALELEGFRGNPVSASSSDRRDDAARKAYISSLGSRNLVLIVVDALRPDHMESYGYSRETTPNLTRIGREHPTRIISDVHSTCGDTACAMFSLFSSEFPSNFSFHPFFLHEALRRNGYRIHLLLSGDHSFFYSLKPFYGPVDTFYDGNQAHGYYLNDDQLVVDRLAGFPNWDGVPVMFQFHLMSAHILRKRDKENGNGAFEPASRYAFRDSRDTGADGKPLQSAVNFYDNGVLQADEVIHDLLKTLQKKGYLQNTLVVVTADHGESLGEHGLFHHANSVREELLRVPLLLISYGYPARPLAPQRAFPSQVDIAPTILSELDLARPGSWVGLPLQDSAAPPFSYFTEHSMAGLLDRRDSGTVWKYWRDSKSSTERVFDLSADPHEEQDLSTQTSLARINGWRAAMIPQIQASLPVP
jgi:glucan phosphoethanolaminetransferase (alkaline phosphatase superfamily)